MDSIKILSFLATLLTAGAAMAVIPDPNTVAAVPEPVGAVVFAAGAALFLASVRRIHR